MIRSVVFCVLAVTAFQSVFAADAPELTFEKNVRPILKAHCFQCHGEADKTESKVDVRLFFGADPSETESAKAAAFVTAQTEVFQPKVAPPVNPPAGTAPSLDPTRQAFALLRQSLLSSNRFLYVEGFVEFKIGDLRFPASAFRLPFCPRLLQKVPRRVAVSFRFVTDLRQTARARQACLAVTVDRRHRQVRDLRVDAAMPRSQRFGRHHGRCAS